MQCILRVNDTASDTVLQQTAGRHTFDAGKRRVQEERKALFAIIRFQPVAGDGQITGPPTGTSTRQRVGDVSVAADARVLDVEAASVRHEAVRGAGDGDHLVGLIADGAELFSLTVLAETCANTCTSQR